MKETVHLVIRDLRTGAVVRKSRPLPTKKWMFQSPPADTPVWRYGDFTKFAVLFEQKQFYFRRADKLADEFEGRFTAANRTGRSELFGHAMADLGLTGDVSKIHEIQESHRSRIFLQCWHQNTEEARSMWESYTKTVESIVLVSTVGLLGAAVGRACHGLSVLYVDEDFAIPEMHPLAPIAHKRTQFAYEREFRLAHVLPVEANIHLDQECDYFRLIPGDPTRCVQQVRFHPRASAEFKARVRSSLHDLGYVFPIRDSALTI